MSALAQARRAIEILRNPAAALALAPPVWNDLMPQLRKSRLLGRFAVRAEAAGLLGRLPDKVREHLEAALVLAASSHESLLWESIEVERALSRAGVPALLLKGGAFIAAGLPAGRGRPSNDLDILVPRADLERTAAALRDAGWEDSGMAEGERQHFDQWMHQIPAMYHGIRNTAVDIHHAIAPIAGLNNVDSEELFKASTALPGRNLRVLAPEDMAIMTAVHWARSSGVSGSVRDFLDIDDLVRDFSSREPDFPARLLVRAGQLGVRRTVEEALALARTFFATPVPDLPDPALLRRLVLLAGVPSGAGTASATQLAARQILTWRSYRMQMPLSLMIRRAVDSRLERFGLKRRPDAAA